MTDTYRCPTCGIVSHHPMDVEMRYCGRCFAFEDDGWAVEYRRLLEKDPNTTEQRENLRLAVAQAYTEEGVRLWWESHRKADPKRRARMEAGVLAEYTPEVAPEPEPAACACRAEGAIPGRHFDWCETPAPEPEPAVVPCDLCGSPTHSTRDCAHYREIQGNWPAPERPAPAAGTDTEEGK